ncbi:MAG: oligosaccharide flippase family protein [Candidatus Cloacimonadaceae bacterium]|jgi:O-antigen/teichoic acid export membrane protein|nr:oligosaccharide flippase family protein [Candidatus Cloacimonadota bacterium]MDY0112324.1 oligosaccharide flippase family protein [Candidatus Syntrophosphaera sp.]
MTEDRSKQAGILTTAEFIRFGFKAIIGIVLARILLPVELGSYRQLFLIYSTFSTFLLLGIPQSVLYFLPKLKHLDSKKEFITHTVNLITLLAFVFALAIFLLRGFIARIFNNPQLNILLVIFAVYPLFMFVTQIYSQIMLGLKQPKKTATFTLISVATDFVFILGTALITRNLHYIVIGVMFSALLQWGYAQYNLRRYFTKVTFDPDYYKEIFQYSLPLGLASIIGILSVQLDKLVVSGFFTPAEYAIFSIGAVELPLISILNNSVNAILLPHISSNPDQIYTIYKASVRKNALIIFPLCALGLIFAEPLITLLYSSTYKASVPIFQVYLINLPLRIATYGIIFMVMKQTKYIMTNSIITLSLNLVLNILLVKLIGMIGAAIATVIVSWLSVTIYLYWIKNSLKLNLRELFPLPAIGKTALSVTISALLSLSVLWIFGRSWVLQIIALLIFIISYYFTGKALNAILPYDIQYIKQLLNQAKMKISGNR